MPRAVVTGGTHRVGRAIAGALASRGMHVLVTTRDAGRARSFGSIACGDGSITAVHADITTDQGIAAVCEAAASQTAAMPWSVVMSACTAVIDPSPQAMDPKDRARPASRVVTSTCIPRDARAPAIARPTRCVPPVTTARGIKGGPRADACSKHTAAPRRLRTLRA